MHNQVYLFPRCRRRTMLACRYSYSRPLSMWKYPYTPAVWPAECAAAVMTAVHSQIADVCILAVCFFSALNSFWGDSTSRILQVCFVCWRVFLVFPQQLSSMFSAHPSPLLLTVIRWFRDFCSICRLSSTHAAGDITRRWSEASACLASVSTTPVTMLFDGRI